MIKVQCEDEIEILKLCDRYLDNDIPEFFFNRSWKGFNDILDVYRSPLYSELNGSSEELFRLGRLHLNAGGLCPIRARASIEYWQIDELLLGKNTLYYYYYYYHYY